MVRDDDVVNFGHQRNLKEKKRNKGREMRLE